MHCVISFASDILHINKCDSNRFDKLNLYCTRWQLMVEILTNSHFCVDVVSPLLPCNAVFLCMPFGCVHICYSSTFSTQYVPHTRKSLDVFTLHIPNRQHNTTNYTTLVQLPYKTTDINNAGSFNGSDLFIWAYTLRVYLLMIISWTRVTLSINVITVNNCQGFIKCNLTKSIIPCLFQLDMIPDCLVGNKLPFLHFLVIVLLYGSQD